MVRLLVRYASTFIHTLVGTTISMPHVPEFDRRHTWRSSPGHSDRLLEERGLLSASPLYVGPIHLNIW